MSARAHCQLNRRRRIVKADICDRHHLPVRAGDKRRQSALFFNGLLGGFWHPPERKASEKLR
jgi:hypothetical protein